MKHLLLVTALLIAFSVLNADEIILIKRAKKPVQADSPSTYTVRPDDNLYKILSRQLGANTSEMPYLYHQFKLLNPHIENLNIIHPDQKITLPKYVREQQASSGMEMKEVDKSFYTIKQGEHLIKILKKVYKLKDEQIIEEYLKVIEQLNPEIKNIDHVIPGQKVKIPDKLTKGQKQSDTEIPRAKTPLTTLKNTQELLEVKPDKPVVNDKPYTETSVSSPPKAEATAQVAPALKPAVSGSKASSDAAAVKTPASPPPTRPAPDNKASQVASSEEKARASSLIRRSLLPAFKQMGSSSREDGKYYMPVAGGNISIDTSEIPVLELDTGKKIILDMNGKITPKIKQLIEKTFPECSIISSSGPDLEAVMDKVLSVSGYFSINKDGEPIIVGSEEKVKFKGKWIVYKDFTRSNVYVINILNDNQVRTPKPIIDYASSSGLDIIDIGGREESSKPSDKPAKQLKRSYQALFDEVGVKYSEKVDIKLIEEEPVNITFKAPILAGTFILTTAVPDQEIGEMILSKGYRLIDLNKTTPFEVLGMLGLKQTGPPLKIEAAENRSDIEIPGIQIGNNIILERTINEDITRYLISTGRQVIIW